jgi:putative FmdB family regulatory protein
MPIYDYHCAACSERHAPTIASTFSARRPVAERDAPLPCPACGAAARRAPPAAPLLSTLTAAARGAHARNERARSAPPARAGVDAGIGGGGAPRPAAPPAAPRPAGQRRPWMIGH